MKRRNRKRRSKVASPPTAKIPSDAEKAGAPSVTLDGTEFVIDLGAELAAAIEEEKPASDSVKLAEGDHQTHSGNEFGATVKKSAGLSAAPAGADRRTHPRYEFTAAVEVVAAESGARIETRIRDLSQ